MKLEKRFCSYCGKEMIQNIVIVKDRFDACTGKPERKVISRCPLYKKAFWSEMFSPHNYNETFLHER